MSGIEEIPARALAPSFGEELRKEREMRGISLKEIADATKISKRFLEAVEKNDLRTLPAPVFTRGFVREYARYLGLNAEEMVTRYSDFLRLTEEAESHEPQMYGKTVIVAPPQHSGRGLVYGLGAVIFILLLLLAFRELRHRPSKESPAARSSQKTSPPPAQSLPPARVAAAAPAPLPGDGLTMEIHFREKTWLTAQADGARVFSDEIGAGQTRTVRAKESIVFQTLGNAGGIELQLNGQKLRPLGPSGVVMHNVRFDRRSIEELKSRT